MAFCLQFRLILWKNLLYRRRQKARFCVEMIWPLFMFFILAWIRKSGLKFVYETCHYTEKSMPSSGLMPYIHTFFCGFNNTCRNTEEEAKAKLGPLFFEGGFENLTERINQLVRTKSYHSEQATTQKINERMLNVSEGLLGVMELIKRKDALNESLVIHKDFDIFKKNLDIAVSGYRDVTRHIDILQNVVNDDSPNKRDNLAWLKDIIVLLKEFICNDTSSDSDVFADDLDDEDSSSYGDDLLQFAINRAKYPTMSEKCISIMQIIESHPKLKLVWRVVKPFFVGKIIYTPVTEVTKRIMDRVDKFFYLIKLLKPLAKVSDAAPEKLETEDFQQKVRSEDIDKLYKRLKSKSFKFFPDAGRIPEYKRTIRNLIKLYQRAEKYGGYFEKMDGKTEEEVKPKDLLECLEANKVEGYHDFNEAESMAYELGLRNRLWGLIHFTRVGDDKILPFVNYTIRVNAERVDDTYYTVDKVTRWYPRARPNEMKYMSNGFLYLQDLIEHSIMQEMTGIEDVPGTIFQIFPYPCHTYDSFITAISATFPFFMVMSWIYTCSMIVKSIVYEKERRLKETMRVMGLGNGIHWFGWFIDSLLPMLFTVTMLTLILSVGRVMETSSPTLIFVFLTSYTLACISFSFLLSVFFERANIAAASAGIIFFFLYLPYPFMVRWMDYLQTSHKFICSIFSMNVALGLGASYIAMFEESGDGMNWNNIAASPRYRDDYNILLVILSLLLDFILFLFLTWYLEGIMPGQYGIPKPWYFPVMIDYWTNIKRTPSKTLKEAASKSASELALDADNFEDEPDDLEPGVIIDKLTKVYRNGKVAVNKLTINFYEGQITSLLGHNGAGKTTTISMLTGIYRPSSGDAYVNGYSIKREMDQVRKSLGMCPQFNVLFDKLTVEEHLLFYGELRGGNKENLKAEIEQMLEDLQLERKKNAFPTDLSGGMQRKLSIAVAYIGGAKTVILDEPTSGVDPYSRRSIWELLIKYKKDRTVILTTHYMDEADLLSDRVAIVSAGRIKCAGSVTFLKERFGKGYEITIEIISTPKSDQSPEKNVNGVTRAIQSVIFKAKLEDQKGSELKYTLPERNSARIASLCDYLDTIQDKIGIGSYGITDCSLEDIFLTVTGEGDQRQSTRIMIQSKPGNFFTNFAKSLKRQRGSITSGMTVPSGEIPKEGKTKKIWRQFKALTVKRFNHSKRNRKALFSEWVSPSLIILFAMLVMKMFPALQERQPLSLLFEPYEEPRYIFHSAKDPNQMTEDAIKELASDRGFGPSCIQNNYKTREDICVTPETVTANKVRQSYECSCATGMQHCSENIDDPFPAHIKTASKEISIDLNNMNVSEWIINTYPKYQINRLGGVELNSSTSIPDLDLEAKLFELLVKNGLPIPGLMVKLRKKREVKTKNWTRTKKVWFNNKAWHSSPILLNYVNNGILRSLLNDKEYGIAVVNHPLNFTPKEYEMEIIKQGGRSILTTIAVIFALSFVPASFTLFIIEERVSNSKHLQLSSGVIRLVYWTQAYIWDMVCYAISAFICVSLFFAFNYQEFISTPHISGIILLLLFYGWAIIPLMYVGSFLFQVPASSFVTLACVNVFIGVVTTVVPYILDSFKNNKEIERTNQFLKKVFLIFPQFCLGDGLTKLSQFYNEAAFLKFYDVEKNVSVFNWDFLFINLFVLFLLGIIFFIVTLLIEFERVNIFKYCTRIFKKDEPKFETKTKDLDDDVAAERERVKNPNLDDLLIIRDLFKKYKRKPQPSVRGLNLGLKAGECFGLLGINGAGKTTTFKMLTGDLKPSNGEAKIKGFSVNTQLDKARAVMGYCPQFDALHPLLTVQETLQLYAEIRGIPTYTVPQTIDDMIDELGLAKFTHKLAGDLSGGNKRKLSTAIALIGKPPVIFLDEPTTGMDPKSRRFLWSCIDQMTKSGTCVVLTSHSMEECQALCTKLTIMVNGQFRCLGSTQHLKHKYGKGYQIIIRFPIEKKEDAKTYISRIFPTSALDEEHLNQIRYHVTNIKVSQLFTELGKAKDNGLISDFSISQTTLEEVFMAFAQQQEKEEVIKRKSFKLTKLWNFLKFHKRDKIKEPVKSEEVKNVKSEPEPRKSIDIEPKKIEETVDSKETKDELTQETKPDDN